MLKRFSLIAVVGALVVGCSSGVKLDDVPVEDKAASSTVAGGGLAGGAGGAGGVGQSGVTGVSLDQDGRGVAGPAGVSRLVYFDYDSYVVKPEYQSVIEAHARYIKAGNGRRVMIEGHTDERGGREYNLALGQKRAEAVRRSLALMGVSDNQVEAVSFGKEKPAVQGGSEEAHAQNRRAELSYR